MLKYKLHSLYTRYLLNRGTCTDLCVKLQNTELRWERARVGAALWSWRQCWGFSLRPVALTCPRRWRWYVGATMLVAGCSGRWWSLWCCSDFLPLFLVGDILCSTNNVIRDDYTSLNIQLNTALCRTRINYQISPRILTRNIKCKYCIAVQ